MHRDKTLEEGRLLRLEEMKRYRVSKGEPDIRDWEVVTKDRRKVGKVHDLIVDTSTMKVRYLDVIVSSKFLEAPSDSHVLIPIAGATLDDDDNRVYLDDVATSHLASLPPYDHRRITRDYETSIAGLFSAAMERGVADVQAATAPPAAPVESADYYDAPRFEEKRFWGRRRIAREDQPYLAPAEEELRDEPLPDLPPDLRGR